MSDRLFAAVWLGVCALIIFQMWNLSVPFAYEPVGPKVFPILLAVLMAACCLALLIRPDTDPRWPESSLLGKEALLIFTLLGYAALFSVLGFPLATAGMVIVLSRLFGGGWLSSLISAVAIGSLAFLLFDRVLDVSLPLGPLSGAPW